MVTRELPPCVPRSSWICSQPLAKVRRRFEELSKRCHASARGTRILCDFLVVAGFLSKHSGAYSLSPTAAAFLDRRSPACMASMVQFINSPKLMSCFDNLTEIDRKGGTIRGEGVNEAQMEEWVTFAKSMMPLMK